MAWLALALGASFLLLTFAVPAGAAGAPGRPTRTDHDAARPSHWHVADALFVLGWLLLAGGVVLQGLSVLTAPGGASAVRVVAGLLLAAGGAALVRWAQRTMGGAWRPDIPPVPGAGLATSGPFARVRNPTYDGMLATGLALVVLAPNAVTAGGWVALLASLMLTARAEERGLHDAHGAAYDAYAAATGRFVPGVGRLA